MREIPYPRIVDKNMNTLRRIIPQSVSIDLKAVPLSYASMKLLQDESIPERSFVELYTCMGSAGVFRVTAPQNAYGDDNITVELEHAITELGDYLVLEKIDEMMSASSAVSRIFQHYRGDKWTMSVSGSALGSGEVAVEVDHDSVLESLLGIIEQIEDCIMTFDFTTSPWTFGFKKMDSTVTAEGRLSRNVQSAKVTYDDSELCTRVYYEVSSGSGADVTTVWKYKDTGTASKYGLIEKVCSTGSNYTESEALRVVNSFIRRNKRPRVSISINAEELSNVTGEQLDQFTIGKLFRLALPDYNIDPIEENITGMSFRDVYGRPDDIVVDLADEEDTVVTYIHDTTDSKTGRGGKGKKKQEETWKEFRTLFYKDDYHITMAAQHLDEHDNILTQAGLYIDSEGILQYADDNANMLYSRIQQTASSIMHEVEDAYNGLYSRITQTASEIRSEVDDKTSSLRSFVVQTASTWESRVEGVVDEDGNITAASIGVAINQSGSQAYINADHIHLTGNTLLSGHLTVEDGNLKVLTALSVGNTTGKIVTINAGKVNVPDTLQISSGAELLFVGSQTGERYSFSASNVGNILTDAAISNSTLAFSRKNGNAAVSVGVSGNSLVFTDSNGQTLSFSKATTLEGAWSGGNLTVNAYQTNSGTKTRVGQFVSAHELSLNGQGSSNFSVEMKTHDTGDSSGALTVRDSKYIYLYENVNGASSTVVAGENADGTSSVASISTRKTFNAGKIAGNAEGQAEYKEVVRSRFKSSSGGYYIEGYESTTGNSISGSDTSYKLGTSGSQDSTKVQIQNSSGTKISETAELPVGSLYTEGFNTGNANRASQVGGLISTTDAVDQHLSAGSKYKIVTQYQKHDGTWANGGTLVVDTPENVSGYVTIDHQGAITGTTIRAQPQFYAKLDGVVQQTLYTRMYRETYNGSDHCVNMYAKLGSAATNTDTLIARISTENVYTSGYNSGYTKGKADGSTVDYTKISAGSLDYNKTDHGQRLYIGAIGRPSANTYIFLTLEYNGTYRPAYIVVNS